MSMEVRSETKHDVKKITFEEWLKKVQHSNSSYPKVGIILKVCEDNCIKLEAHKNKLEEPKYLSWLALTKLYQAKKVIPGDLKLNLLKKYPTYRSRI